MSAFGQNFAAPIWMTFRRASEPGRNRAYYAQEIDFMQMPPANLSAMRRAT
jgi:antirestriction protein ArdC